MLNVGQLMLDEELAAAIERGIKARDIDWFSIGNRFFHDMMPLAIMDDNHEPVYLHHSDAQVFEDWFKDPDRRRLGRTNINGILVSTVFLPIDHSFGGKKPLWFETMLFKGEGSIDGYSWRYETWKEAKEGHEVAVVMIREGIIP